MTDPVAEVVPGSSRKWRLIAAVLLLLLLVPATWLARRGAAKMEFFQLRAVSVEGVRYLSTDAIVQRLALDTTRSVWDDTEPLAARLRDMPQVSEVEIRRKLPGTLVVTIRENLPVALAPSPRGLEAVDSTGVVLPIDPIQGELDLPIANQRDIALLSLLGAIRGGNPALFRRISEISRDGKTGVVMLLAPRNGESRPVPHSDAGDSSGTSAPVQSAQVLRVRALVGVSATRLADIFPVESDLLRRRANVAELDLRYRDQVIARLQ